MICYCSFTFIMINSAFILIIFYIDQMCISVLYLVASHTIQSKQRAHTSLVVVVIVFFLAGIAALAIFIFKKSGRSFPKPAFENPLYFNRECPKPDVVDTNQLIENAEKDEEDQAPIITL